MICKPKNQGGLGVLNLRTQNKAVLVKHLYKSYNQADIPWVILLWNAYYQNNEVPHAWNNKGSFWWKDCIKLFGLFKSMTTCEVNSGNSALLWEDNWNGPILKLKIPELHYFTH